MSDSRFEVQYVGSDGMLYLGDCTVAKDMLTIKMGTVARTVALSASAATPEELARATLARVAEDRIKTKKRT